MDDFGCKSNLPGIIVLATSTIYVYIINVTFWYILHFINLLCIMCLVNKLLQYNILNVWVQKLKNSIPSDHIKQQPLFY